MNIIPAIILGLLAAVQVALTAQVPATRDSAREAFNLVDTDADTYVTLEEYRAAAALFGIELTDAQVASFEALAREWGPGGNDEAVCFSEWVSTIDRVDFDGDCYQSSETPFWLGPILCYE